MKKIYVSGNYVIAELTNGDVKEFAINKCTYEETPLNFVVNSEDVRDSLSIRKTDSGTWFDESGAVAYTEETLRTFLRNNTGFKAASGGSGADLSYTYTNDLNDPKLSVNIKQALDRIITKVDGGNF